MTVRPFLVVLRAPPPVTEGTLNAKACGEPICGVERREKRTRRAPLTSLAVPSVERGVGAESLLVDEDRGRETLEAVDVGVGR